MSTLISGQGPNHHSESLQQMVDALSDAAPGKKYCEDCGSLLVHLDTLFWLDGLEKSWNIALPYCDNCNPGIARRAIPEA
jgi:hypothetical protein